MLKLDPWTLFFTVFNVMLLFLAFKKFLLKPVLDIIEKRDAMIKEQFEAADYAQTQAMTLKTKYEQQLEAAHETAATIITNARARAEEEHNQALVQTRKETQKMLDQAKIDIQYEQDKARLELQAQIADIAMAATRKIIRTGEIHDAGSN